MVHGKADEDLPPAITAHLVDQLCAAGVEVGSRTYPDADHDGVMAASANDTTAWVAARLTGDDPPSSCKSG